MKSETLALIRDIYNDEATDAEVYAMLAARTKSAHNREILRSIAADEIRHRETWAAFLGEPPRVNAFRVRLFSTLARVFGIVFVINLMESGENESIADYRKIAREVPEALAILEDETRHEAELVAMIEEDGLTYISSMVLGLNDALVELTGALAGFTLALNDNTMIGLAGFITGVAATLSMAASEYLSKKADPNEKHPLKAAAYTGVAYLITVALLLAPYAVASQPLIALAFCLLNATLVITGFSFFVAVVRKQPFWQGFREMMCISFGVALISFLIGWAARLWLHIDV